MADASRRCTTRRRRLRARYATSSTLAQAAPPARACSRVCAGAPAPPPPLAPALRPWPAAALQSAAAGGPAGAGPAGSPLAAGSSPEPEPAAPDSGPGPAAGGPGSPAGDACSSAARAGCGLMLRAVELEPMAGAQARNARCGERASAAGGGGSHCARRPARPGSEGFRGYKLRYLD